MIRNWLFVIILLVSVQSYGQDNRRCIEVRHADILSDTQIIDPNTVLIEGLGEEEWELVQKKDNQYQILFKRRQDKPLKACFRVLPAEIKGLRSSYNKQSKNTEKAAQVSKEAENTLLRRRQLLDLGQINQGGQISRGISVGNTQDLFVNSTFNLNLEGKLSEDLNIRASITDQNIPYEPEGNTQQLQDFDNVSVELYNDKFSVAGGDIVLQNQDGYFLKYLKNAQGGMLGVKLKNGETSLGISSAKGRFGTVDLNVEEGVSGPYAIRPSGHTGYVIIIANSEKVYLDGKLLSRGFNNDYIIDYNQAEISFTSNLIITRFSRVRIDFEYAVQDFARSIKAISHNQQMGKFRMKANYYEEKDNRNRPLFKPLSNEEKELLSVIGDNLDMAVSSGAREVPYSQDRILYSQKDTVDISGDTTKIYIKVNEFADLVYDVQFTDVGSGKGSYVIGEYLPQGRVYTWVGKNKGSFVPYILLAAPNKKSMVSMNVTGKLTDNLEVYSEAAFSNHDLNLFSELDNEDNRGYAIKTGLRLVDKPVFGNYKLSTNLDGEFISSNFRAIDRFRRVEFDRDWSDYAPSAQARDMIGIMGVELKKNENNLISYRTQLRNKEAYLSGTQHWLRLNKSIGQLQVNAKSFFMNSDNNFSQSSWQRVNAEVFYRGKIEPGVRYATDRNTVRDHNTDSLISSANYFSSGEFFLRNSSDANNRFEIAYIYREDQVPSEIGKWQKLESQTVSGRYTALLGKTQNLNIRMNYRVSDEIDSVNDTRNSISGSISWSGDVIPKVLRHSLNYNLSNARVAKREYVFVPVPTGEGTHTWRDDNLNGEKELNEFYEAINFDERNYIKLYVPTTQYVEAFENILGYKATLKAPASWRTQGGLKEFVSRFSNTTTANTHYRTTGEGVGTRVLPFLINPNPSDVLSMRSSLRSTVFFNRTNPKFGLTGGVLRSQRKFLYTNGFESRDDQEFNVTARWNIKRAYQFKFSSVSGSRNSSSDYLENRNFTISDLKLAPSLSWQPSPTFRVTTTFQMGIKKGDTSESEDHVSKIDEVIGEMKYGSAGKFMVQGTLKYSNVLFNGNELSPLGYEMLEGNRPGGNVRWQLNWQQTLLNGLQIGIFYEGRKPADSFIIHTGRAMVSAYF